MRMKSVSLAFGAGILVGGVFGSVRYAHAIASGDTINVLLQAAVTFVNDNWNLIADADGSGTLTAGDLLRNDNDTLNPGSVTASYGTTGFGVVTTESVPGTVTLTQDPSFDDVNDALANTDAGGTLTVLEGTFAEDVVVTDGVTLAGVGTITGSMTANSGATLAPGLLGTAGTLGTGDLQLGAGAILLVDVETTPGGGADQVNVTGTVNLTGSTLSINGGFQPPGGSFVLINNDGTDLVVGTFAGLPEDSVVTAADGRRFRITYIGGDGNDVVLTVIPAVPALSAWMLIALAAALAGIAALKLRG